MKNLEFTVRVLIDATPQVVQLFSSLMGAVASNPQRTPDEKSIFLGGEGANDKVVAEAKEPTTPAPKKPRVAKAQPVAENMETETVAPIETAPVEAAQENKTYTEVDVREAMDRTRKRIEGENWKENPDSEGYKKWHRRLTAFFKNTAALYGAEKPSTLPDSESREKFIKCCDAVYVKDDELVEDCPF